MTGGTEFSAERLLHSGSQVQQRCVLMRRGNEGNAERPTGALVAELPRQTGSRENRWAHLLSGVPAIEETPAMAGSTAESGADVTVGEIAALRANVARLEAEVDALKGLVTRLCAELGVSA